MSPITQKRREAENKHVAHCIVYNVSKLFSYFRLLLFKGVQRSDRLGQPRRPASRSTAAPGLAVLFNYLADCRRSPADRLIDRKYLPEMDSSAGKAGCHN